MIKAEKGKPFDNLPDLPPTIDYTLLISGIAKAHSSLARLDEVLSHLKMPNIIEYAFLTREALLSSKIEGTQATLEEVFAVEKKDLDEYSKKIQELREVINYRQAIIDAKDCIDKGNTLSENTVKKLHKILLQSVRGRQKAPGIFRKIQVHIAPPGTPQEDATYVPPTPQNIIRLYSNFDKFFNSENIEKDPLVQLALSHYQFEAIHPFNDGNGRIGRLLIPLYLYRRKIISYPYIYVSKYFEEHRRDYYDLLADVSYENKWIQWIRFFLNGLCEQAREASKLARKIMEMREEFHSKLSKFNSPYALNLLDALFKSPICSTSEMKKIGNIKHTQTLINLVKKFEREGILNDLTKEKKRNKIYVFSPLMDILNAEAE